MPSTYRNAIDGLKTVLGTAITGPRAPRIYTYPADNVSEFPAIVLLPEDPLDYDVAFGGNTFEGTVRIVFLVGKADKPEAYATLYDHMDPTEAGKSVKAAVETDRSLNGAVDDAHVTRAENVGRRQLWGGDYVGCDFILIFVATVA